ncbi:GNAT family N-acetyltransferase [Pseudactinotalea sp. HY160]|uniref:GNAT family N-acetyltransferase n=1 Tax=Pseudactinotalea sp. HY160 TaxID=2654490 RepID=UPI00351B8EA2
MRAWGRSASKVTTGREIDPELIVAFCAAHPIETALMAEPVQTLRWSGALGESVLVARAPGTGGELSAVCWIGGNIVPVGFTPEQLDELAGRIRRRGRRFSSIVGPADQVLGLWERLRDQRWPVREIRSDQPSLLIDHDPIVPPDPSVRPATMAEFDLLLPAAVAMFTEEVGYSPLGVAGAYERRVRELIAGGRSLVRIDDGPRGREVVFKADLGTLGFGVTQVQGVWIHPAYRGRSLAAPAVSAVIEYARRQIAPTVSLYVNSYNGRALATYERVGFERIGTFASVLF